MVVTVSVLAAAMLMLSACVAVAGVEAESVAFTVKFAVPATVGVPVIAPVPAFSVKPVGREPVVIDQVTAPVPPVAPNVALYAEPTVPPGKLVVEIANGELTVIVRAFVAVCAGVPESVAFTVKLAVPAAVGVPVIAPVLALSVSPAGSAPEAMDQVTAPSRLWKPSFRYRRWRSSRLGALS